MPFSNLVEGIDRGASQSRTGIGRNTTDGTYGEIM